MSRYKPLVEQLEQAISSGTVACLADLAPAPPDWEPFVGPAGGLDIYVDMPRAYEIVVEAVVPGVRDQTFCTILLAPEEAVSLGRALIRAGAWQLRLKPKADAA